MTRIITFAVGNPYEPSLATVTGWGLDPNYCSTKKCRVLKGPGMFKGPGVFLGNPQDSIWEDWGTLGESPPPLKNPIINPLVNLTGGWKKCTSEDRKYMEMHHTSSIQGPFSSQKC